MKSCPFCGCDGIFWVKDEAGLTGWGHCAVCQARGPIAKLTESESAKNLWNYRRPKDDGLDIETRTIYRAIVSETKQRVKLRRMVDSVRKSFARFNEHSWPAAKILDKRPFCPFCKHHHFLNVDCPKGTSSEWGGFP